VLAVLSGGVLMGQARPPILDLLIPYSGGNTWYGIGSSSVIGGESTGSTTVNSLLRTDDGGRTWTSLYVAPVGEFQFILGAAVHPDRPQIVYAVLTRARGGFHRSEDGGRT
jgi:photosystem II stability/assembly factor-like uncharacterized protein